MISPPSGSQRPGQPTASEWGGVGWGGVRGDGLPMTPTVAIMNVERVAVGREGGGKLRQGMSEDVWGDCCSVIASTHLEVIEFGG